MFITALMGKSNPHPNTATGVKMSRLTFKPVSGREGWAHALLTEGVPV